MSVFLINSFTVYDAALGYSFGYSMPEAEQTTASRVFPVELYLIMKVNMSGNFFGLLLRSHMDMTSCWYVMRVYFCFGHLTVM